MKNRIFTGFLTGLVFLSISSLASDNSRQSIAGSLSIHNVELMVSGGGELSSIGGANVGNGDIRLGAVWNNHFTTAVWYQRSMNDFVPLNETTPGLYAEYQSVGGLLEFTIFPNSLLHASFPLKIGYGHLEMDSNSNWDGWTRGEQHLFVLQPGAFGVLNIAPAVSLYAGATYRFTNSFEYRAISSASTRGLTGQIGFKFHIPTNFFRN